MPARLDDVAEQVVQRLGIAEAIRREREPLRERLAECDRFAQADPAGGAAMFVAMALPIVNSFIHFATSRSKLAKTTDWVRDNWPGGEDELEPLSTIAALTLVYILRTGIEDARSQREERDWERMYRVVERLTDTATA